MSSQPEQRDDHDAPRDPLAGVSVEPNFDDSWLSKEPPGYEDVDDDGQVIESADGPLPRGRDG